MSDWETAVITGATGILGVGVGGLMNYAVQRGDRRARERDTLAAAVSAYTFTLDLLHRHISELPQKRGRAAQMTDRAINAERTPHLYFVLGRIVDATTGRQTMVALDRFMEAHCRLMPIAPRALLPVMRALADVITSFETRDEAWRAEYLRRRGEFDALSRKLVGTD